MKLFIVDLEAECGICQLGEDRATTLPDGSLRYRPVGVGTERVASPGEWSRDYAVAARAAHRMLMTEIAKLDKLIATEALRSPEIDPALVSRRRLLSAFKDKLCEHSTELKFLERQLSLFA